MIELLETLVDAIKNNKLSKDDIDKIYTLMGKSKSPSKSRSYITISIPVTHNYHCLLCDHKWQISTTALYTRKSHQQPESETYYQAFNSCKECEQRLLALPQKEAIQKCLSKIKELSHYTPQPITQVNL